MSRLFWKSFVLVLFSLSAPAVAWQPPVEEPEEIEVEEPAVREVSPLLFEPETPEEHFDAVVTMVRFALPNLARQYLESFLAMDPDDDLLLELRERHGPATFLGLLDVPELRPLAEPLLDRVNAAFQRQATDPARIDRLINDLAGEPRQRAAASVALRDAGIIVVPAMLRYLGDPQQAELHPVIQQTLIRMGEPAIPALLGALDAPNDDLRSAVIDVLGRSGVRAVAPYLWHPAFSPAEPAGVQAAARQALARLMAADPARLRAVSPFGAAAELQRIALEHFRREHRWPVQEETGAVEVWTWLPQGETVGPALMTPEAASVYVGSRFARQALGLAPENRDLQALSLALALAWDSLLAAPLPTGPGTAHNLALLAGPEIASLALAQALRHDQPLAAVAALQVLGQIGSRQQLYQPGSGRDPILTALNFPDRRVQFAAASAILQLDPERPFRGTERIVAILTRALNDRGGSHSLVVDPNVQRAGTIAGLLGQRGFEPHIETTGRDGFRAAAERPDIDLVLLHLNTIQWDLSQTVANLRADARTADLPIALYGPEPMRAGVRPLLARFPRLMFMVESTTAEHLDVQLRPFLRTIGLPQSPEERAAQREAAAFWLAHLAHGRRTDLFDLRPAEPALAAAVYDPDLASNVLRTLAAIATPGAQGQLQQVAVNELTDAELRELAALHLAFHIQRFGLLLTRAQIAEVKAALRTAADPQVATALSAVVGTLQPTPRQITDRLEQFPLPTVLP